MLIKSGNTEPNQGNEAGGRSKRSSRHFGRIVTLSKLLSLISLLFQSNLDSSQNLDDIHSSSTSLGKLI